MSWLKVTNLEKVIFASRWILYPINLFLMAGLVFYVSRFFVEGIDTISHGFNNMESLMLFMLGLVDAAMVANLIIMVILGGHQIFIQKFQHDSAHEIPQFLEHMDTGILKVKVALSISGITLVQILRDFLDVDKTDWTLIVHRAELHVVTLFSALTVAIIWRVIHPGEDRHEKP